MAVGGKGHFAGEGSGGDGAQRGVGCRFHLRGIENHETLRGGGSGEAVGVAGDDFAAGIQHGDGHGSGAYRGFADSRVARIGEQPGGIEGEHGIAVARGDVDAGAVGGDGHADRAAAGRDTGHHGLRGVRRGAGYIHHDDRALRVGDLGCGGIAAFGFAGFGPVPIGHGPLAGGVEPFPIGRERERDGSVADRNLSNDGIGFVAVRARAREIDDGDGVGALFADEQQFVAGRDVGVNALGIRAVTEGSEDGVGGAGGHALDIQKDRAVGGGGNEQLTVVCRCEAGGRGFERDDTEKFDASSGAREHRDAGVLCGVVAHQ